MHTHYSKLVTRGIEKKALRNKNQTQLAPGTSETKEAKALDDMLEFLTAACPGWEGNLPILSPTLG